MKKLYMLLIPILFGLASCNKLTVEQAEAVIMNSETERLPLILQSLPMIDDITVDSIRLTITDEPMQGYLYTTWVDGSKRTPIIIQVTNVHNSKERSGYVEWQTDWESAAQAYLMREMW